MRTRYLLLNFIPAILAVAFAILTFAVLSAWPAHAAEVAASPSFSIDLSGVLDRAIETLAVVLLALGSWAGQRLLTWIGLQNDAQYRAYLDAALANGITYAKAKLAERIAPLSKVETQNQLVALASTFVIAQVPGALSRFGFDPRTSEGQAAIARLVTARLPAPAA